MNKLFVSFRIYQSVNQDNVGMPAVVYGNFNRTLRGRPAGSEEWWVVGGVIMGAEGNGFWCPFDIKILSHRSVNVFVGFKGSYDRLISMIEIPTLLRPHLYIGTTLSAYFVVVFRLSRTGFYLSLVLICLSDRNDIKVHFCFTDYTYICEIIRYIHISDSYSYG